MLCFLTTEINQLKVLELNTSCVQNWFKLGTNLGGTLGDRQSRQNRMQPRICLVENTDEEAEDQRQPDSVSPFTDSKVETSPGETELYLKSENCGLTSRD